MPDDKAQPGGNSMESSIEHPRTDARGAEPAGERAGVFAPPKVQRKVNLYKSPVLASFLSIFPGLGQVYVGYYQRGFAHMLTMALCITLLASGIGDLTPLVALFLAFFWLYNIVDAGRRAALYNQALDGIGKVEMPQDLELPFGGSLVGGATVAVLGVLLLLNTRFDMSLAWVGEWWPLALVGFGVYLIAKWWQSRD
jgi:TM2 domain-containing membrane protein YozV